MRTASAGWGEQPEGGTAERLRAILRDWVAGLPPGTVHLSARDLAPGVAEVLVTPANPRASSIRFFTDEPGIFNVYLGENTWWLGQPFSPELVVKICEAVRRGHFREHGTVWRGRVIASEGELQLPGDRWHGRGSSFLGFFGLGEHRLLGYEPYDPQA